MSEAEPPPKDHTSQSKPGWSPPRWLLQVLAKCWWLIGFEFLGLLGVVLLYPLSQGFAGWWQNVQTQVAALIALPPTHPYLTALLAATLPLLAGTSFLAHRTLEREEQQKPFERLEQRLEALQAGLKPLPAQPSSATALPGAAPRPPTRFLNVPPRNLYFTGRDDLLQRLHAILKTNQQATLTQTQAITGLGGIGKTQTALEYAYRHQQGYQNILWAQADTREALTSACLTLAGLLELPEHDAQEQAVIVAAVQRWLATHADWLFILDNVDDLALLGEVLPAQLTGQVLLTARDPATGTRARALPLETLPPADGALLVLRRAKRLTLEEGLEATTAEVQTQARELSETLGGLPLALDQAGAYLEKHGGGIAAYQALFQTHRVALLGQRGQDAAGHLDSVTVTVTLALEPAAQARPAAAELLRLCALLHPEAIPEELFTEGAEALPQALRQVAADPLEWEATLAALRQAALIERQPETQTLSVHRLVQAVLKDALPKASQRRWAERVVHLVEAAFPGVEFATWGRCQRLVVQAQACAEQIAAWGFTFPEASRLLNQAGFYLHDRAAYAEALPLYQRALAIDEQALGPEHPTVATSLNNLAELYRDQGQYEQALPLYERALTISEQALGPEHPTVATSLNNLANLYRVQGQYEQALPLYERALAIREQALGPEHPDVAQSLNNLASFYQDQGQDEQALPLFQRALAIHEQALGPDHPNVAIDLNNLAELYRDQGQDEQALPLYQRALTILEQALGPEHPNVATALNNLAELYRDQGQYEQALPLYQRALTIWELALGPEHPTVATSLNNLASFYQDQGQDEQALPLYQRALTIWEQALGPEHPNVATGLQNLAALLHEMEHADQARPLEARAQTIRSRRGQPS